MRRGKNDEKNRPSQQNQRPTQSDPHSIMVCTWHPKLRKLPSILNKNYAILENDAKLCTIFKDQPTVAFRRKKNLGNILCKNDIKKKEEKGCSAKPCKCQVCEIMKNDTDHITNHQNGLTLRIQPGATCKSTGVVYTIQCKQWQLHTRTLWEWYEREVLVYQGTQKGFKKEIRPTDPNVYFSIKRCLRTNNWFGSFTWLYLVKEEDSSPRYNQSRWDERVPFIPELFFGLFFY